MKINENKSIRHITDDNLIIAMVHASYQRTLKWCNACCSFRPIAATDYVDYLLNFSRSRWSESDSIIPTEKMNNLQWSGKSVSVDVRESSSNRRVVLCIHEMNLFSTNKNYTHAVILFFHDDTYPAVTGVKDINIQSGEAVQLEVAEDFVRKNAHYARKVCPSEFKESHAHNLFRWVYIVILAGL